MSRPKVGLSHGTEDELGTAVSLRQTSRRSDQSQPAEEAATSTPYTDLRQLASMIHHPSTPGLRAASTGPSSTRKALAMTPASRHRTPGLGKQVRPMSYKVGLSTTPHVVRALQRRQAAKAETPARNRRWSVRHQHKTPRDALRNLSKALATTTMPSEATSQLHAASSDQEQSDNEGDLPRPRLSIRIDELDDDSFEAAPTRRSINSEADMHTERSVEVSRRAVSELPFGGRRSLASIRMSERYDDPTELGLGGPGGIRPDAPDFSDVINDDTHDPLPEDASEILSDFATRAGRLGDIRSSVVLDQDQDTSLAFDIQIDPHMVPPTSDTGHSHNIDESVTPRLSKARAITASSKGGSVVSSKEARPKIPKRARRHLPSLSSGIIKKLATPLAQSSRSSKSKISKETLGAIIQASDWFFEQIGSDLGAFAEHASRRTVDETDVMMLMKRQRKLTARATPFSLAQQHLPRELLQDIRMTPVPPKRPPKERVSKSAVG